MPTPTIPAGNLFMNATLYTGNGTGTGSTLTVTNGAAGASFQPDFIWIKSRSTADYHNLNDIVRGIVGTGSPSLFTNTTGAEATFTGYGVSALNSNGFNLIGNGSYTNTSGTNYVAWQWKAGGTAVTNTSGTISSQVSANTTSGFSVVTYTGTGTGGATIGHGLGVAPSFIAIKSRSSTESWQNYHVSLGGTKAIFLNLSQGSTTSNVYFNDTSPTSSVFSLGAGTQANGNGTTYVAYCWAPIAGYSAFGSYTGNGSTDGPFVYTGFRPRFVMVKCSSNTTNWWVYDSSRNTYNEVDLGLLPSLANAETSGYPLDFLSNGFKFRNSNGDFNGSGRTYIYMAFAENPFKYALAR